MSTYNATAITLLAHKFKGSERIVVFFSLERGRVDARVSGVGKPGSRLAAAAEPLTLARLQFAEGKTMDRLTQVEVIETFYNLRNDLRRLAFASYICELVARTTEQGHPEPEVFEALALTLNALQHTSQVDLVTWAFVLKYLCIMGIAPGFAQCVSCDTRLTGKVCYAPGAGGCLCPACHSSDNGMLDIEPQVRAVCDTLQRMPLERLDRIHLTPGISGQLAELLGRHVKYHLGVTLNSELFLQKMARAGLQS